jgi:pilus assembly protein Flp/PilA
MRPLIQRFLKDESAATAIEYGLIAALLSLAVAGGASSFSDVLEILWSNNTNKFVEAFNQ